MWLGDQDRLPATAEEPEARSMSTPVMFVGVDDVLGIRDQVGP